MQQAKAATTFLGKGSHGTPGSEMKTSELLGSEIVKTNIETKKAISGLGANAQTTFLGTGGGKGGAVDISDAAPLAKQKSVPPAPVANPPLPPAANPGAAAAAKLPPSGNATGSYAQAVSRPPPTSPPRPRAQR